MLNDNAGTTKLLYDVIELSNTYTHGQFAALPEKNENRAALNYNNDGVITNTSNTMVFHFSPNDNEAT